MINLFDNNYVNSPPPLSTSNTTDSVTADQVQALYQELLGRSGADEYVNAWAATGGTIDDIRQGIMGSAEYQALQSQGNGTGTDSSDNDDGLTGDEIISILTEFMKMNNQNSTPAPVISPSRGGSFSPAPIQRLSYSSPQVAPISQGGQVDYVKQVRAGLVNSLFKDMI